MNYENVEVPKYENADIDKDEHTLSMEHDAELEKQPEPDNRIVVGFEGLPHVHY